MTITCYPLVILFIYLFWSDFERNLFTNNYFLKLSFHFSRSQRIISYVPYIPSEIRLPHHISLTKGVGSAR